MDKKLIILIILCVFVGIVVVANSFHLSQTAFQNAPRGGGLFLLILAVSAAIDSINPCAFSVILLTIAFLASLGKARSSILIAGALYIAGTFVMYILIGLGILQTLNLFNIPHFMAKVGASILIVFGAISMIGVFLPAFPVKLKIPESSHRTLAVLIEKASLPAAFLLGALVGVFEFPCTGGPYLMVLGFLHDEATRIAGFGYLIIYNIIFIIPLIVILLIASDKALLDKVQSWKKGGVGRVRFWSGLAMVALGLFMFTL